MISALAISYNEESNIEKFIESLSFADEIIIVDSNSTDKTVDIANKYNCKILQRKFDNFSNQKNHALQFANCDWVLFVDADERIPFQLQVQIIDAMNSGKHNGFKLKFPQPKLSPIQLFHAQSINLDKSFLHVYLPELYHLVLRLHLNFRCPH